ncbi:glucose 1,6-bisphosphate synthase [Drosophila ficusphila]|uniref:glucose 1,6-bisphosphate synthase n=1 Tax=Drosophila ficusphila TaxID=30025 RepID=UPI0007E75702|nr:glucose 1,6-bisphosphate synthase [Drosophila ficusphila]
MSISVKRKTVLSPQELLKTLNLSGDEELDQQIQNWVLWDRNEATLNQVLEAVRDEDWEALRVRLCHRITYLATGLRGGMRAGFDSLNDVVIIEAAQGICAYLIDAYPSIQKRQTQGIVVGYDGRYNSKRFAQLIATVFLNNDFKVFLFTRMTPTPFIPFTIVTLNCLAGIVITASHNPKEDNGLKVYWSNGAQAMAPHDQRIRDYMMKNLEPKPSSWETSQLVDHQMVEDPYRQIYPLFYETLKKLLPPVYLETNECSQLRFVYTPLHGVGFPFMREAFYQARLKPVIPVLEQKDPDPEFPTLVNPNPEEGKDAFKLAIRKAEAEHCTLVLANDPDVDRLAIAELNPRGRWKIFNGNEIAALLGWWALENYKTRTPKPIVSNCVMISTLISSRILSAMARIEGFVFVEGWPSFPWMAHRALELQKSGRTVLFAFEDCFGYMFGMSLPDKDGIGAAMQLASMACYLRSTRNVTLIEKLREIYETYGYHSSTSSVFVADSPDDIVSIFDHLRNFKEGGGYPNCILEGEFEVVHIRDLTTGLDTSYSDEKARMPINPDAQLITFTFTNGYIVTLRSAANDLKIKLNAEICGLPEEREWEELHDKLTRMTNAVVEEFLAPEETGLVDASVIQPV